MPLHNEYETRIQASIESIADDLYEGKCVLFLGPELLISQDEQYYKAFFKEFAGNNRAYIEKYFPRDSVFLFKRSMDMTQDAMQEKKIRNGIKKFYDTPGDEILLNLIAQLPFPLIINVAPDNAINKMFAKNDIDFRPAFFPQRKFYNMDDASLEHPIIYNIFGSIEETQSIVLTHAELFKTIKDLMQKDAIPKAVSDFVSNARSFIFLGMKFETWYYQLLLSVFNLEVSRSVKWGALNDTDDETVSIMNEYFQVGFFKSNSLDFISRIYDQLKATNPDKLKTPVVKMAASAYISYAWKDDADPDREKYVEKILSELGNRAVKVFRDRNELTIQDSIRAFMDRIGRGRAIVLVVSEKYLFSEYCMFEAWSIFRNDNFKDRAFVIVMPDVAEAFAKGDKAKYIEYWQEKTAQQRREIETKFGDYLAFDEFMKASKTNMYIYLFINSFLDILTDTIWPRLLPDTDAAKIDQNNKTCEGFAKQVADKLMQD